MAISEPILAFTLTRLNGKAAVENGPPPPTGEELSRRLQDQAAAGEIARVSTMSSTPAEAGYPYVGVPPENVAEITKLVFRIRASHRRHLEAVYEIGADLLRAKELLGHGNFLPWLQSEFRWSERTANNYMSIARFFQDKAANFADLDIGTATALASRSAPAEVRDNLLKRASAGEIITRQEVKERLAASREVTRTTIVAGEPAAFDVAPPAEVAPSAGLPGAIVARLNAEELMLAGALRPALPPRLPGSLEPVRSVGEDDGHKLVGALLELEGFMARLSSDAPARAVEALRAAQSEPELQRVKRFLIAMLEMKLALDDKPAVAGEPEMLCAS